MSSTKLSFGRDHEEPRREDRLNLVRFFVGETCYAFDVAAVEEVANAAQLTGLPGMASGVAGVADHRGRVIPIVDLRARFGLTPQPPSRHTKWILMKSAHGLVGFVVDRVLDVVAASKALTAAPHVGTEAQRGIRGVVSLDALLVFLLDEDVVADVLAGFQPPA